MATRSARWPRCSPATSWSKRASSSQPTITSPWVAIASGVTGGQVYLNVAKDAALNSGWDTVPDAVPAAMAGDRDNHHRRQSQCH